jgi:predicted Rossmann-fold nucleotide-binding protein
VPVVLVGADYWRCVINIPFLIDEGVIDPEDAELFWYAEDAPAIWSSIVGWYRKSGLDPFGG